MSLTKNAPIGVIGSGSFGTAIAYLLSLNNDVLIYSRNPKTVASINNEHLIYNFPLPQNIKATDDIATITSTCQLIFPIVPSENFREMMRNFSPYLGPHHFLIHGTKGLDISSTKDGNLNRTNIYTMSEIIAQESNVIRIGCLSGPNLSKEIMDGQPAAAVIGSNYDEVITAGQNALRSSKFQVYGTHDMKGAELCGALKNIIAIGSGIVSGKGYGKNSWALLVSRGLVDMITIGKVLGSKIEAFLGIAGIGDLVATASSENSRNFSLGYRLGKGETLDQVLETSNELAEGYYTLKVVHELMEIYKLEIPIMEMIYKIVYLKQDINQAIEYLMIYPHHKDVSFLDDI